ncbi:hypothetical protein R1sor_022246 [Riccia sorocarpa]|uniref:Uncharacterized protein n=1 Tax=Riccia sorocarpa TaxID=122646 RepID=A0ABD3GJA8_9MARC
MTKTRRSEDKDPKTKSRRQGGTQVYFLIVYILAPNPKALINRPTLFDLWREFRYFADVIDRKYLSHLDFFIEAKAGRFFGSKKRDRKQILLSSLTGFEEELERVKTYLFWKRRQFRRPSVTPKSILMAPKTKKERAAKTHAKVFTPKKTTRPPSSSNPSTPKVKMGPCKPIALPTTELKKFRPQLEELGLGFLFWRWDYTAKPLVKEFFMSKSKVALPHRGKPHEWTVAHYRRMLGRTKEQEEPVKRYYLVLSKVPK